MAIRKSSSSGIPFGNTAGRPANPGTGQLYSNGQLGRLELYTSTGWQNIVQETPGITGVTGTYNESAGSGTFTISGTNFVDGGLVYAVGTNAVEYQATTSTYNSIVQMTAVFTGLSPAYEPYDVKVVNPSNLFGLLPDAFYINDNPVWSTNSGSLGSYTSGAVNIQLAATDDESNTLTYSITSGSLPSGLSLSSSGLISGTITANPGTYSFTVGVSDGYNTTQTRSFNIIILTPTVTGGNITISGNYRIHTFTSSDTFATNAPSLNIDYLIVAGGGGGGGFYYAGGGGAGGYLSGTTSLSPISSSVIIGSGGASISPSSAGTNGNPGNNSSAFSLTATGGGYGGSYGGSGGTGGSGGGAGGNQSTTSSGGSASPSGQGNIGGNSSSASTSYGGYGAGGGGGGAGGSGGSVSGAYLVAGAGGLGLANSISGTSLFYAAGGGGGGGSDQTANGGAGGSGIGGNGASTRTTTGATAGAINTGSGGGGAQHPGSYDINRSGAAGGSGIVIVRYLKSVVGL